MTTLQAPTIDTAKSEAFAERLLGAINEAAMMQLISIGHRTGLFDTMHDMPPATSGDIAKAAGLNERYVREWLGGMVTSQVVAYDPAANEYALPAEHAAWLTRAASPDNVAVMAQYFAVMGSVEDDVVACFERGGGVPYERFGRFHEVMAEDSGQTVVAALFDHLLPLAPWLTPQLERGIEVLDIGCGRGRALLTLAERFPNSSFVGYDLSEEATGWANARARERGLTNVRFAARDVTDMNEPDRYDLVFAFDAIHDQMHPAAVLENIHTALKTGGTFFMQDIRASSYVENNIDHPIGTLLYTISTMHCMTVSLAGCGCGLGTVWGEELALEMLGEAGFEHVDVRTLEHDFQNNYYIMKK